MTDYYGLETKIEAMIDELQGLCSQNGLSNSANEEVVVTTVFLYKFLNDKFMHNIKEFADEMGMTVDEVLANENDELDAFYDAYPRDVVFHMEDTIEALSNQVTKPDFADLFDGALERISNYEENDKFKVETADGEKKPLFESITDKVEKSKRKPFAESIFGIITTDKFDFSEAYESNFDFYSSIFEHLIKNYNVASGKYAEYFTPQAVSEIIAKILVHMSDVDPDKLYEVYDAAAGSGSLVLHLANELGEGKFGNRARVYTQDISQKSSRFLRINMMLNGLTESLDNIVEGDTLLTPAQYNVAHDPSSGYKKFDYITINPPFKMDFSTTRDNIESKWADTDRFFAGLPNIPDKKKDIMAIYLCFIQHVLWSLKDSGKAAIVLPTGFLTAKAGIEMAIRQKLIDSNWLQGVISMPSNIFANTGTNVSVIFVDKSKSDSEVILIDASKLGEKRKEGKNQRTVLRDYEVEQIEDVFINREIVDDFSVLVTTKDIQDKNYSFSAGQYFEVKLEYVDITHEEFESTLHRLMGELDALNEEGSSLDAEIKQQLGGLNYA
ncbi:HsdM family class I SAM-dependent methyltransferase [Bifidobacterium magnum]|uniref:site-specific DNA-methyltransferase (adenine-specific) n=1 Tax=Bifidobacterium magnum TaxID=1692 RepID=A0A087B9U1_9BIFI|nr:class I SAM-dependent DNA methyltransferase [Bifidobacterium magnum]KFI67791.1 putative Type I N6-adenine DNA methyltransferase (M) subunit of unknown recognition sequence [Bifidobacterium magnum]